MRGLRVFRSLGSSHILACEISMGERERGRREGRGGGGGEGERRERRERRGREDIEEGLGKKLVPEYLYPQKIKVCITLKSPCALLEVLLVC